MSHTARTTRPRDRKKKIEPKPKPKSRGSPRVTRSSAEIRAAGAAKKAEKRRVLTKQEAINKKKGLPLNTPAPSKRIRPAPKLIEAKTTNEARDKARARLKGVLKGGPTKEAAEILKTREEARARLKDRLEFGPTRDPSATPTSIATPTLTSEGLTTKKRLELVPPSKLLSIAPVGRIASRLGDLVGTGVRVAPSLLITMNRHLAMKGIPALKSLKGVGLKGFKEIGTGAVKNSANTKKIESLATKIIQSSTFKVAGAASIALLIVREILERTLGGRNFGNFIGMEEAHQTLSFAGNAALRAGNFEGYDIAAEARDEVLRDLTFWEKIKELIPSKNEGDELEVYRQAAITAAIVQDKTRDDLQKQEETGQNDREYWEERRLEQIQDEKDSQLRFEESQKRMIKFKEEAEDRDMVEDAAFWAKEREKERELEKKNREAMAAFWIEYRKQALQFQRDNAPSNLKFGLL